MNVPFLGIYKIILLSLLFDCSSSLPYASNPLLDDYKVNRDQLPPHAQVTYAIQKIASESDPEILQAALYDILKFSATPEEIQTALQQVEAALAKLPGEGADFQKIMLFKAKVLRRLGKEEGNAIFGRAYEKKWPQYQYEYELSLFETGDLVDVVLLEYDRASGHLNGTLYQVPPYEEGIEDLGRFKLLLSRIKLKNPEPEIGNEIIAKLDEQNDPSLMKECARALCLSEYGRYEEANEVLAQAETNRDRYGETPAWKDLSLYKSMILMDEGKDIPTAQAEFRNYMAAREGEYKVIYSAGDRFLQSLQREPENIAKTDELAALLIESPIIKDEAVKQTFRTDELAHLYDVCQIGLGYSGKFDEAAEINKYVYANYFPSFPAASCAWHYASYVGWHDDDPDRAMDILNTIAAKAPYDTLMPGIRVLQAEILLKKGMTINAYNYVQEAITRCNALNDGTLELTLKSALELQKNILEKR